MKQKPRIEYIDLAKGICIIFVVMMHVTTICWYDKVSYPPLIEHVVGPIRMPLYFLLSGLFFKTYSEIRTPAWLCWLPTGSAEFIRRKTNKILVPFVFFFFGMGFLLRQLPAGWEHAKAWGVSALWFLECLFEMNVIFFVMHHVAHHLSNGRRAESLLCLLSLSCGVVGFYANVPNYHYIMSALTCMPFFWLGYFLRSQTSFLVLRVNLLYLTGVTVLVVSVMDFLYMDSSIAGHQFAQNIFVFYFIRVVGVLTVLFWCKPIGYLPFVSYLGRYSIIVLVTHLMVGELSQPYVAKLCLPMEILAMLHFLLILIVCRILIPFCRRFIPWFVAQKDLIPPFKQKV